LPEIRGEVPKRGREQKSERRRGQEDRGIREWNEGDCKRREDRTVEEGDEETRKEGRARRKTLGRKSREGGRNEEGGIKCCREEV
jgi:hypothetical protein